LFEVERQITHNYESEYDFRPMTECSEESLRLSNKKVRISDVIASYQSSIIASNTVTIEELDPNSLSESLNFHNRSIPHEKAFTKGDDCAINS
jgi:hypothetical protein